MSKNRIKKNDADVYSIFNEFNTFGRDSMDLFCISTNDVAPEDIKYDLTIATKRGTEVLKTFVEIRLSANPT